MNYTKLFTPFYHHLLVKMNNKISVCHPIHKHTLHYRTKSFQNHRIVHKLLFCMKIVFRSSKLLQSSVDALISVLTVWYSKNDVWFRSLTPLSSHMRASCENERKHFAVQYTAKGHGNANLSINIVSFGHSSKRVLYRTLLRTIETSPPAL